MNRAEQVSYCRKCTNRKFDTEKGIICSLTNEIADFFDDCQNFNEDGQIVNQTRSYAYNYHGELTNLASQGKRFVNFLIDYIAVLAFSFFIGIVFEILMPGLLLEIPELLLSILIYTSFYIFFELVFKQTPGKMLTRTKVVAEDGSEVTGAQVFSRSLCRIIPFEAFSFLGSGPGWHDKISGTRVIDLDIKITDNAEIELN